MTHLDDDTLAVLALGEPPDAVAAAHLASCRRCADELASLAATARVGRQSMPADRLARPEPRVWDAIVAQLDSDDEARRAAGAARRPRRIGRRAIAWTAAAAVALIAAAVTGILLLAPRPAVEATAQLDAFPDWPAASGSATLQRAPDGTQTIEVELASAEVPDGDAAELWLIDPETSDLVSLGLLDGGTRTFAVPPSVDTTRFSVVDISAEPDDGDPAHSGDSIVRGALVPGS